MGYRRNNTTSKTPSCGKAALTVAEVLQERASKRAAKAEERTARSEKLKDEGNALFRKGDYLGAAEFYQKAVAIHSSVAKPVLLTNLAAAYLKLGMAAEACFTTTDALLADPRSIKARFRRGVARQEMNMLDAAAADFRTVICLDPGNREAKSRLDFVEELFYSGDSIETGLSDDEYPFGDEKCTYSHSKEHLPTKGWWTTEEGIANAKHTWKLKRTLQREVAAVTEGYVATSLGSRRSKAKRTSKARRNRSDTSPFAGWDSDGELNEYGFTNSDTEELLCQGVKPWDDDAHEVLAVLRNGY
ncbi:hypothetical protein HYDPIDRAFT_25888 [Hydnomerulius pinastri MD-312]|nr:hypothetical protein HYDPIDRAFT_25888 [Hydnomerulius pinastri MD-312]